MALPDGTPPQDDALYGAVTPGLGDTGIAPQANAWDWIPPHWLAGPTPDAPAIAPSEPLPGARDPLPELASPMPPPAPTDASMPPLPTWLGGADVAAPPIPMGPSPDAGAAPMPPPSPETSTPPVPMPYGAAPAGVANSPSIGNIHTETHAEQYSADPLSNPNDAERDAAMIDLATHRPKEFARIASMHEQARAANDAALKLKFDEDQLQKVKDNVAARQHADEVTQQKRAQLDADVARIASTKLNSHRYMDQQSGAGKVAVGLATIIGGLVAGRTGGPDTGAAWLQKQIDNDVDMQKSDLDNQWRGVETRKGEVADEFRRNGDAYQAAETVRIAGYQTAIDQLQAEQQKFQPGGTQSLKIGATIAGMQAARAQAQAALDEKNHKEAREDYKATTDRMREIEANRHNLAGEAEKAAKAGAGGIPGMPTYGTVYPDLNSVPPKLVEKAFPLPGKNGQPGGYGIAASADDKKDATHLTEMYVQANSDLNELEKISLERDGAKSTGGAAWDKWKSTNEQHYDQLLVDLANVYGMMIHGRAPTQGVLEEVMTKSAPELKSIWQSGDTTKLLEHFHNDIDNRTSLRFGTYLGKQHSVSDTRPHVDKPNINTISSPMLAPPVKGASGYARFDVGNFGQSLSSILDDYVHNPGLGGEDALKKQYNDIDIAQRKAASEIRGAILKLETKPKRTATEDAELQANRMALKDRNEAIRETQQAREANLPKLRTKLERDQIKQSVDDTTAGIAP